MAKTKQPEYAWIARTRDTRRVVEGRLTAPSEDLVRQTLISRNMIPLNVTSAGGSGLNKELSFGFSKRKPKRKDLAVWARQFSIMLDASITVIEALRILAEQTERETLRDITSDIKTSVESGKTLSEGMQEHVDVFGELIVNMVDAGEKGGFLDGTLAQIAVDLEKEVQLRAKVRTAMTYPVVVLAMAFILCSAMLLFIVPIFSKMFADMGGQLPLPTRILVGMSDFLKVAIVPMVIAGIAFGVWWKKNHAEPWIRNIMDPFKLKVPVFGDLFSMISIGRFTRNLGTLIRSGVPILTALDVVHGTVGNVVISRAIADVRDSVSQGESIAGPLKEHDVFPPMVTQMIATGEDAGNIEFMLQKIADDYDQQVGTKTEQLSSLIEPFMIIFLGVIVGAMIISLYMPIFSMFDLVK